MREYPGSQRPGLTQGVGVVGDTFEEAEALARDGSSFHIKGLTEAPIWDRARCLNSSNTRTSTQIAPGAETPPQGYG